MAVYYGKGKNKLISLSSTIKLLNKRSGVQSPPTPKTDKPIDILV